MLEKNLQLKKIKEKNKGKFNRGYKKIIPFYSTFKILQDEKC